MSKRLRSAQHGTPTPKTSKNIEHQKKARETKVQMSYDSGRKHQKSTRKPWRKHQENTTRTRPVSLCQLARSSPQVHHKDGSISFEGTQPGTYQDNPVKARKQKTKKNVRFVEWLKRRNLSEKSVFFLFFGWFFGLFSQVWRCFFHVVSVVLGWFNGFAYGTNNLKGPQIRQPMLCWPNGRWCTRSKWTKTGCRVGSGRCKAFFQPGGNSEKVL